MSRATVLLTTEGTYPFYRGGVSVWCQQLIERLPSARFHVLAITHTPGQRSLFPAPANLAGCTEIPLWGTEEPGMRDEPFSQTYGRKLRTAPREIRDRFLPPFQALLRAIRRPEDTAQAAGDAMAALHRYFQEFDYALSMGSNEAWEAFRGDFDDWPAREDGLSLHEATQCMRWLQRYLVVLAVPLAPVDVSHASMAGLAGIPGVIQKILRGTPYLLTEHGVYLRELYIQLRASEYSLRSKRFLLALNEAVVRTNYHFADRVSSLTRFNADWQIRLGARPDRITMTPNGSDPEVFQPRPRKNPGRLVVLTTARIYALKGISVLLRAAALVRERAPEAVFRILGEVGSREYHQECLRIVRENGLENMVEWGRTDRPAEAYNDCDVFCLPSISEGMPFAVIEAMLSGCPVVASDVGGVSEVVGNAGLLVRPNDPPGLADALVSVLAGPDAARRRAEFSAAGLERARANFTLDHAVSRFKTLYEELQWQPATLTA